jgi:hypothetical protein
MRLVWRVSRRTRLPDDQGAIRCREAFGWLKIRRERVGAVQLFAYEVPDFAANHEFMGGTSPHSGPHGELFEALCDNWEVSPDLGWVGPVVELRTAWMAPSYTDGEWMLAAEMILASAFGDYSILIGKAAPLEYTGLPTDAAAKSRLDRRRAAMVRYGRRLLGMQPLPGPWGELGWLWRPNLAVSDQIPNPEG